MKKILVTAWSCCIGVLCIAQEVQGTDYDKTFDFSTLKTYQWKEQPYDKLVGMGNYQGQSMQKLIHETISARLKKKKFNESQGDQADFHLAIHTGKMDPVENVDEMGYRVKQLYFWEKMNIKSSIPEGLLVIDVIDAESNSLVWRGWGLGPLPKDADIKKVLNRAVRKILKSFPPKS